MVTWRPWYVFCAEKRCHLSATSKNISSMVVFLFLTQFPLSEQRIHHNLNRGCQSFVLASDAILYFDLKYTKNYIRAHIQNFQSHVHIRSDNWNTSTLFKWFLASNIIHSIVKCIFEKTLLKSSKNTKIWICCCFISFAPVNIVCVHIKVWISAWLWPTPCQTVWRIMKTKGATPEKEKGDIRSEKFATHLSQNWLRSCTIFQISCLSLKISWFWHFTHSTCNMTARCDKIPQLCFIYILNLV